MSEALDLSKLYYLLYLMMILFIFNHFNFPNHSMNDTRYFYQSFIKPRWAARLSAAHGSNQVAAVMRTKWRPDLVRLPGCQLWDVARFQAPCHRRQNHIQSPPNAQAYQVQLVIFPCPGPPTRHSTGIKVRA